MGSVMESTQYHTIAITVRSDIKTDRNPKLNVRTL